MTCKIERPEPQILFDRYLNMFSNTVLGGAEIIPESNEWYAATVNYAIAEEFYAITEQSWKEQDPRTACCENMLKIAAADGAYPRPATYSQGFVEITGVANTSIPSPLSFVISGKTYKTSSTFEQPANLDGLGVAIIRVAADEPGEGGNTSATTGKLSTAVVGVDEDVTVMGGSFCGGEQAETCEIFRTRYLSRMQYHQRATNDWILTKLSEWPCATRAMVRAGTCSRSMGSATNCGCEDCGGCLSYYVMFDNTFPCGIAPPNVLQEIQTWMFGEFQGYGMGQAEIGICGSIAEITPHLVDVHVGISECPTAANITTIESQIVEYFQTLEPSKPLYGRGLDVVVSSILGAEAVFDVTITIVAPDGNLVELDNIFTPECDFLVCLGDLTVTRDHILGNCT